MLRFWLFVAGLSGATAIIAGAAGAHRLELLGGLKVYEVGQLYHMLHSIVLFGIAALIAATEGRRHAWATWLIQIAGIAFVIGILLFSGGIYHHVTTGITGPSRIVPVGGAAFITGWVALALAAFGLRGASPAASRST